MFRLFAVGLALTLCAASAFAQDPPSLAPPPQDLFGSPPPSTPRGVPAYRPTLEDLEGRVYYLEKELVKERQKTQHAHELEMKYRDLESRLALLERRYHIYEDRYRYEQYRFDDDDDDKDPPPVRLWNKLEDWLDDEDDEEDDDDYRRFLRRFRLEEAERELEQMRRAYPLPQMPYVPQQPVAPSRPN